MNIILRETRCADTLVVLGYSRFCLHIYTHIPHPPTYRRGTQALQRNNTITNNDKTTKSTKNYNNTNISYIVDLYGEQIYPVRSAQ